MTKISTTPSVHRRSRARLHRRASRGALRHHPGCPAGRRLLPQHGRQRLELPALAGRRAAVRLMVSLPKRPGGPMHPAPRGVVAEAAGRANESTASPSVHCGCRTGGDLWDDGAGFLHRSCSKQRLSGAPSGAQVAPKQRGSDAPAASKRPNGVQAASQRRPNGAQGLGLRPGRRSFARASPELRPSFSQASPGLRPGRRSSARASPRLRPGRRSSA